MRTNREQLRGIDKEALIDGYLLLEGRVRTLEKQVEDLRKLLDGQPTKAQKTSDNSAVPPSQDQKVNKKKPGAKRGPKVGHEGKSRQRGEPDEIIECRLRACDACGHDLSELPQHEAGRHQVTDIPPISPLVREVVRYGRYCPACGTYQCADAPKGFEPGRVFGENIERLVVYLHHAHPLSYQRVQHILREVCGLDLSQGALVNVVKNSAFRLKNATKHIQAQVKQAAVIGSDETTARLDGQRHWQWVFQTPQWVWMLIHPRRNGQVLQDAMGTATPEVWVSDLGSAQLQHSAHRFQVCLAHQVRDLQYTIDAHRCAWAYHLQNLFYRAMRLRKHRHTLSQTLFAQQVAQVEAQCDHLMTTYPQSEDSQRLWRRFRKYRDSLFIFLQRADVPPTNNASEQALRNSVIYRKVTGGFRTDWGADLYADVISILETARRQKRDLFHTLATILDGQPTFSHR
jgi:transposase